MPKDVESDRHFVREVGRLLKGAAHVDATQGGANANAYATQAAAIAAAAYRIGPNAVAFVALTSDQQIQALVSAAPDIDSLGQSRGVRRGQASSSFWESEHPVRSRWNGLA